LVDTAVHSEHGKVIQCDFKPGSVEKFIKLENEIVSEKNPKGIPLVELIFNLRHAFKILFAAINCTFHA
jgi:hypothetical protein